MNLDLDPCLCGGDVKLVYRPHREIWETRCDKCPSFSWGEIPVEAAYRHNNAVRNYRNGLVPTGDGRWVPKEK